MGRNFTPTNSYVEVASVALGTDPITFVWSAYIDNTSVNLLGPAVYRMTSNALIGVMHGTGALGFRAYAAKDAGSAPAERYVGSVASIGWHRVSASLASYTGSWVMYVDGVLVTGTNTAGSGGTGYTLDRTGIGTWVNQGIRYYSSGSVADCAIYNRAFTASEHLQYAAGVPASKIAPEACRALWYPNRQRFGTTDIDFSGFGQNLSPVNSPVWCDDHPLMFDQCLTRIDRQQFRYSTYTNSVGDGEGEGSSTVPDGLTAYADKVNIPGPTKRYVDSNKITTQAGLGSFNCNLVVLDEGE